MDELTPAEWELVRASDPEAFQPVSLRQLVSMLAETGESDATIAARRYRVAQALARQWEADYGVPTTEVSHVTIRALRAEVAAAISVSENEAGTILHTARVLHQVLPRTLAELGEGRFSDRHVRSLVEVVASIPVERVAEFETAILPHAYGSTVARFARKVRSLVARFTAKDAVQRHAEAFTRRAVWVEPEPDGMVLVMHRTSAENGLAVLDRLARIAKPIATAEGEERTLDQVMSDVLDDLLLDEGALLPSGAEDAQARQPTRHRGVRPQVHITVPVLTAMGRSAEPGELEGYGPIDAETARSLAGAATGFYRILTDPETGVVLSVGRQHHDVPVPLRRYLQLRDGTCRFVGCSRQAKYCDVDHTLAFEDGGETSAANLAHLCRGHHRVKHATGWKVEQSPGGDGTLDWTSPTGRRHRTSPRTGYSDGVAMSEWSKDDPAPF